LETLGYQKSQALKGALVGGAIGAATGGAATLITSFIEKNNISCHIGDGLDKVSFGKTGKIDTLKDFYVKWNLQLPDTIRPTALVSDCASWKNACATIKDISLCANAQINYKKPATETVPNPQVQLIENACAVSGSICTENTPVAISNGACQ